MFTLLVRPDSCRIYILCGHSLLHVKTRSNNEMTKRRKIAYDNDWPMKVKYCMLDVYKTLF